MKMEVGTRVYLGANGTGTIVGHDYYFNDEYRYVVELDDKSRWIFSHLDPTKMPRFFPRELTKITN
ncbi:hypothetical protein ACRV3Q_001713 [Enterobacter hormaechei]